MLWPKAYGMNPEVLKQTFADFNKSIEAGKDEEFNRKFDKGLKSLLLTLLIMSLK